MVIIEIPVKFRVLFCLCLLLFCFVLFKVLLILFVIRSYEYLKHVGVIKVVSTMTTHNMGLSWRNKQIVLYLSPITRIIFSTVSHLDIQYKMLLLAILYCLAAKRLLCLSMESFDFYTQSLGCFLKWLSMHTVQENQSHV